MTIPLLFEDGATHHTTHYSIFLRNKFGEQLIKIWWYSLTSLFSRFECLRSLFMDPREAQSFQDTPCNLTLTSVAYRRSSAVITGSHAAVACNIVPKAINIDSHKNSFQGSVCSSIIIQQSFSKYKFSSCIQKDLICKFWSRCCVITSCYGDNLGLATVLLYNDVVSYCCSQLLRFTL